MHNVRAREVNRRIKRLGGVMVRQAGSHRRYVVRYADAAGRDTAVPRHSGGIPAGTLRAIGRDLGACAGDGMAAMSAHNGGVRYCNPRNAFS
jgi:predicted RNA binding protein YcfA (HicA-like mRNA interferase family)